MSYSIYLITNTLTNDQYIGKTKFSLERRFNNHVYAANAGSPYHFHCALRKYGPTAFTIALLETIETNEQANQQEQYWISVHRPQYNMTIGGNGLAGFHHRPSTKEMLRQINTGKTMPQEIRNKISQKLQGRIFTEHHRRGIAESNRRRKMSDDTKRKISNALKGHIRSEESKRKQSASNVGKKRRPCSEETKRKISETKRRKAAASCPERTDTSYESNRHTD